MTFTDVVDRLAARLREPLPGSAAQALMAPWPRRDWPVGAPPGHVRHAAGLLLVIPINDRAHVVLTERARTLGRHGGQVSLPGGVVEPGETHDQAARREAHEEIGLDADAVVTLGALTSIDIAVSGFRLHPILAMAQSRPTYQPSSGEVARVLEMPVDDLLDHDRIAWGQLTRGETVIRFPGFPSGGALIWGATAMVLAEFLALLGWTGPNSQGS